MCSGIDWFVISLLIGEDPLLLGTPSLFKEMMNVWLSGNHLVDSFVITFLGYCHTGKLDPETITTSS